MASFNSSDAPPSYYNVAGQGEKQQEQQAAAGAYNEPTMDNKTNPYQNTVYNEMGGGPSVPQYPHQQGIYNMQPGGVYVMVGPQQPAGVPGQVPLVLLNGRPDDYLCWSIFTVLCCNTCCLGWIALYFSIKSRTAADSLNMDLAINYSRKAKSFNEKLLAVGIVLFVLSLIFEIIKHSV